MKHMRLRSFFVVSCLFFLPFTLFSQGMKERRQIEDSFVLLRNNNNIIPFEHLDSVKIDFFGDIDSSEILLKSIRRYTRVKTKEKRGNLLILSISDNSFDINDAYISHFSAVVICVFGKNSRIFSEISNYKNIKAIIFSPRKDSLAYDYCGQLLFGGIGAKGRLKKSVSEDFLKGAGIDSRGGIRFKYTIPAELGLDSAYIYQKIDSIAEFAISNKSTPGCEIFAAKDQKVFFYKSYGFFTYDSVEAVRNNDLYDLASITKIAASAPCLMLLDQKGLLNLQDKFSKYWRPFRHSNKKNLILIDALCHQGRLTPWIPFWKNTLDKNNKLSSKIFRHDSSRRFSVKVADSLFMNRRYKRQIYKEIKNSPLLKRKKYKYSDLSFYIYPQIIKKLAHKNIEQCLYENFYDKLGANSLCYRPLRRFSAEDIVPTEADKLFRKQLLHGYVHDEGAAMLGGISGHAGLFGNANDLAKLMQMYLNYGVYGGYRYINENILRQWTSYQFTANGNRRGIVFDKPLLTRKERGTPCVSASDSSFGHSGFTGTFAWADPQNGLLFIFLSNRVYPSRKNKKLLRYNIRTNIHQVLYNALKNAGKTK